MSESTKGGYAAYNNESREGLKTLLTILAWLALFALIIITAVHAVSIVIRHHGSGTGVLYWIRVAAPIMTEVFTALVTMGFALHVWRGVQRWLGLLVEVIWILFASLNLISDFAMEGGATPSGALSYWIMWGLPISAVITGVLFYFTLRTSPENKRIEAEKAAAEKRAEATFAARQEVYDSAAFESVRRRRAWVDIVNDLKREGYDDHEIAFMAGRTPGLMDGKIIIENQANGDTGNSTQSVDSAPASSAGQGGLSDADARRIAAALLAAQATVPVPVPVPHANGQEGNGSVPRP